ncbi:hypothetical protein K461DRAFT_308672 [Myriangium duriaei CBS 260.36]|uniref:Uncharacterized protein n=1 Tax=Myriangium duriaei CBS 260.36 TaxID=1168546 RepID=A0A9P4ME62_9PEZI|nr:hypothetical protein K461DRAFT_308672 [Myriangium duriaei CBS 260.36]
MLSLLFSAINRLLPFATPGTPLIQDLLHLGAVCALLYFAPQIQSYIKTPPPPRSDEEDEPPLAPPQRDDTAPALPAEEPREAAPQPPELHHPNHIAVGDAPAVPRPAAAAAAAADDDDADAGRLPGPAGPANTPANRPVGAKKARSLARRDQRRAYNEFLRSQGEAQRARDAEGQAEREAAAAVEKERRARVEGELRERERLERERRREVERVEREEEGRAREGVGERVEGEMRERGWVDLRALAGEVGRGVEWVEDVVRDGGWVEKREGEVVVVTEGKVLVRVRRGDVEECWRVLGQRTEVMASGKVGYEDVARVLEEVVRGRSVKT